MKLEDVKVAWKRFAAQCWPVMSETQEVQLLTTFMAGMISSCEKIMNARQFDRVCRTVFFPILNDPTWRPDNTWRNTAMQKPQQPL